MKELAEKIAVAALNYETGDYDVWFTVESSCEHGGCFMINLESKCGKYDVKLKISEISIDEGCDCTNEFDTDWFWSAKFEIDMHEDSWERLEFWGSSVKYLWIYLLSGGWK